MSKPTIAATLTLAQLAQVIEALDEGLVVRDASRTVIAANQAAAHLLGATVDEVRTWRPGELVDFFREDGTTIAHDDLPSSRVLADGIAVEDEILGVRRDGTDAMVWVRVCARPVDLPGGERGVATSIVNVTAERALVAEAREAHDALNASQDQLRSVLGSIDDYLYAWRYFADGSVEVTFESMSAAAFLGCADDGNAETLWLDAVHEEDRAVFDEAVLCAQRRAESGEHDYRIVKPDGSVRWVHERWRSRRLADGSTLGEGIVSDVTQRLQMEDDLLSALAVVQTAYAELEEARATADRLACTDVLTGAANRRAFRERLAPMLESGESAALVLVDIDHFKSVNDTYGHQAGDEVLVEVSNRLHAALGDGDMLARWGGEEFAVCLAGVTDTTLLRRRCEDLRLAVGGEPIAIPQGLLTVTASFGAALARDEVELDVLINRADGALYQAKRRGRDQARLADDRVARTDLDSDLPDSIHVARALALAASVREGAQELHTEQVGDLAARIAEELGQAPIMVLRCRLAGLLHDVGKVAIPDAIFANPGALSDADTRLMRSHAAVGAEIVSRIAALAGTTDAIRHHHERWDGKGYPDGLAGEQIPLEARIVGAADAYSAMTSDRVYKSARERADALRELVASTGTHFDPTVVAALFRVLEAEEAATRSRLARFERDAA